MRPTKREPLLARCAPSSKEHGVLKILAVEAKLDRSVERAFLVLTLQRPRFRRLSTGWAQRAPDGLLIWSSGDEVWEWLIPGSKPPEEVIYAEVFVEASEESRGCLDSPSSKRLGHFEVDLVAFEHKEDELPQRLVSHFFTPAEAGDANACFVGKMRLSLQVSWECRGGHGVRELRRQTREVNQLVDEVLQEERLEICDDPGRTEKVAEQLQSERAESRYKAALRQQQKFQEERRSEPLKQELSMTQWVSRALWEERCGCKTMEEMLPPQELLAEQLIWWRKRLHEVETQRSTLNHRMRSQSPRMSKTRNQRHRLGPSCTALLPGDVREEVHVTSPGEISLGAFSRSWECDKVSHCGTSSVTATGAHLPFSPSLGLEALLDHKTRPGPDQGLDFCKDGTSEVSRFLRQHRGLPEAQQLLSSVPSRPLYRLRAQVIQVLERHYGNLPCILDAFESYGANGVTFKIFQREVMKVGDLGPADIDCLWYSLSPDGRCVSIDKLGEFLYKDNEAWLANAKS